MANVFSKSSMEKYETLHSDLRSILDEVIKTCTVDFSLTEGYRSSEVQFDYYRRGRELRPDGSWVVVDRKKVITNIDGHNVLGKHNHNPSLAVDIMVYVKGKPQLSYDAQHLAYIAGAMMFAADKLYSQGLISHKLRWGGNWDRDGDLTNQNFFDMPHFELIKP